MSKWLDERIREREKRAEKKPLMGHQRLVVFNYVRGLKICERGSNPKVRNLQLPKWLPHVHYQ